MDISCTRIHQLDGGLHLARGPIENEPDTALHLLSNVAEDEDIDRRLKGEVALSYYFTYRSCIAGLI